MSDSITLEFSTGEDLLVEFPDGQQMTLEFSEFEAINLNFEVPADYAALQAQVDNLEPLEVVDNLLSDSAAAALAARQGKTLDNKNSQLRTDVGDHDTDFAANFNTMLS